MIKSELLSPAGSLKHMAFAFAYGADAVYAGQPRYSLRVRNNEFTLENLGKAIEQSRSMNKRFYVAANISPHNSKIRTFKADMAALIEHSPDALIMSDPGMIMMVRENWPDQEIHLSVQANVTNFATAQFWYKQGIRRIILSRELSLKEIEEIRSECPDLELEVFVHGALCIAYSGRCLLSGYFNHRDPNQGTCTNACRWKYDVHSAEQTPEGDIVPTNRVPTTPDKPSPNTESNTFLLQEEHRPGEYMPIFEDEHGTYIMNSKDLRAVQHVEKLVKMGVHSLKIEGRTKSFYYAARTAQVYRQAIDDAICNRSFDKSLMDDLEKLASRGYTEGFLRRHVHDEYQNYQKGHSVGVNQQFVGEVLSTDPGNEWIEVGVKNRFSLQDSMELITPEGNFQFSLDNLEDKKGNAIDCAKGSGHTVKIRLPFQTRLSEYCLLCKNHTPHPA